MNSFCYFTAADFVKRSIVSFEINVPIIIDGITLELFEQVKDKLIGNFGKNQECTIVIENGEAQDKKIFELEYVERLIVKASGFLSRDFHTFGDLVEIIRRLRDPDGCPWDRAQTHNSIKNNAIEEAYELAEAIELDDTDKLIEESGDVMLQGLFHAAIAEENGRFSTSDLINSLCNKLIGRHTHVFGENKANTPSEALKSWEKAKAIEKNQGSIIDKINSIPITFGALMRAHKVQKVIKKTGFDFPSPEEAKGKILEELLELTSASNISEREWEGGDLLFSVINYLRMLEIDPETALNSTTNRFIKRFEYVEKKAQENGFELNSNNIELMEKYYQESKQFENN